MNSSPLFVLPTFNEQNRLEHVIQYYSRFGKIIIVDNFSTDNTLKIAEKYGIKVLTKRNSGTTQTSEWTSWLKSVLGEVPIIALSCSELMSPVTITEIQTNLSRDDVALVRLVTYPITKGVQLNLWGNKKRFVERGLHLGRINIGAVRIHAPYEPLKASNFKTITLDDKFYIEHLRVGRLSTELIKVISYAKVEAHEILSTEHNTPALILIKSILRELVKIFNLRNIFYFKITISEIFIRIVMHLVIYSEISQQYKVTENLYSKRYEK